MSASRISTRALKHLTAGSKQQTRKLHMTGPATYASPLLTTERSASKISKDVEQISATRPSVEEAAKSNSAVRHFNTSRSLKAVNDTSTIDFAYLPELDQDILVNTPTMRMPLLPHKSFGSNAHAYNIDAEPEPQVMRPEIVTVSADSTHIHVPSAMHEVHDNNTIDFHGMTERVASAVNKSATEVDASAGMVKKVWNGLLDDVFGSKAAKA